MVGIICLSSMLQVVEKERRRRWLGVRAVPSPVRFVYEVDAGKGIELGKPELSRDPDADALTGNREACAGACCVSLGEGCAAATSVPVGVAAQLAVAPPAADIEAEPTDGMVTPVIFALFIT